jgi:hypothetical protein
MAWTDVSDFVPGRSRKAKRPHELSDEAQDIKGARHCTLDFSVAAAHDDAKEEDSGTRRTCRHSWIVPSLCVYSTHKLELHGARRVPLQCVGSSKRGSLQLFFWLVLLFIYPTKR